MTFDEIAPHYQLVVTRANYSTILKLRLILIQACLKTMVLENLRNRIHHNLKTVLGIETKVPLVEHKSLERFKAKQNILDLRNNK